LDLLPHATASINNEVVFLRQNFAVTSNTEFRIAEKNRKSREGNVEEPRDRPFLTPRPSAGLKRKMGGGGVSWEDEWAGRTPRNVRRAPLPNEQSEMHCLLLNPRRMYKFASVDSGRSEATGGDVVQS
jgi:hypothetical protein